MIRPVPAILNQTLAGIFVALVPLLIPFAALAQDAAPSPPSSDYVSRAEYDKLKTEHEAMKQEMEALKATVKQMANAMATPGPAGGAAPVPSVNAADQAKAGQTPPESAAPPKAASDAKQIVAPPTVTEAASTGAEAVSPELSGPLATHTFSIVGDAEVQYAKVAHQHGAFALADFAPIFLFRGGDKILFEAGFDFVLQNNAPDGAGFTTTVNLSFATIDYLVNDYVTGIAGDMLLPLGTYSERSAGWLNKIPDEPLPRSILPGNGVGLQLRGGIPVGQQGQSLTYSVFAVNGPGSVDGTGNAGQFDPDGNVGITLAGDTANLHGGLGYGGRVAYFIPWKPQYDLEVGLSGMTSPYDNADKRQFSAGVVDMALHVGPAIEVKGEYVATRVETSDKGTLKPNGWWVQGGYKLSGLKLNQPYLDKLELIGRYDTVSDGLGTRTNRGTAGAVYYLTNTLWLESDYEFASNHGPNPIPPDSLLFQISYGF
jgi:hypothetical protein